MNGAQVPLAVGLNALTAGLILLSAFGMVATRQVQGVMRFFILQSAFLALSAFDRVQPQFNSSLGPGRYHDRGESHCIPWVLKRTFPGDSTSAGKSTR